MKNIANLWSYTWRQYRWSLISVLVLLASTVAFYCFKPTDATPQSFFRSVELGLAELSPLGEAGGFAVPASGGSVQSCTFDINPNPAEPSQAVTGSWTAVFQSDHASNWSSRVLARLHLLNAEAQSTDPDGDDNGGGGGSSQHPVRTLRVWRCNTGTNCIRGQGAGWTQLIEQTIPFGRTSGSFSLGNASASEGEYLYDMRIYYQMSADFVSTSQVLCSDNLEVEEGDDSEPSQVNLEVAKIGSTNWKSSETIYPSEQVQLRWTSSNTTSCVALSPLHNFQANGTSGTDTAVDEPPVNTTYQYRVACTPTGGGPALDDMVTVNTIPLGGSSTPPTIDATDIFVPRGQNTGIIWNTNGNPPASCTLNGPGIAMNPVTSPTGTRYVIINSESTYTIECPAGEDSVTVHVLPVIQET